MLMTSGSLQLIRSRSSLPFHIASTIVGVLQSLGPRPVDYRVSSPVDLPPRFLPCRPVLLNLHLEHTCTEHYFCLLGCFTPLSLAYIVITHRSLSYVMHSTWRLLLLTALTKLSDASSSLPDGTSLNILPPSLEPFDRPKDCPPCFNCNLEDNPCQQFGNCTASSGTCSCPPGFGGLDCSQPMCGSLARGDDRQARPANSRKCACDKGWTGINCNVCTKDDVCNSFTPDSSGGVCYKGGLAQKENFNMCDITNRRIVKQLQPRIPQATFSCNAGQKTCGFQCKSNCSKSNVSKIMLTPAFLVWVDGLESFYCGLESCAGSLDIESNRNATQYACDEMKCRCVPGRMLCGEKGSVDIGDYLKTMTGPASFKPYRLRAAARKMVACSRSPIWTI